MQQDSPDAVLPPGGQPEPRRSPAPEQRYLSIDILRALAILLMIEVHAVDHLSRRIPYPDYLNNITQIFGHLAAPLFTLVAGLSYALWLRAQQRAGRSTDEIVKYSLRRGLFVFGLGFVVNVFIWLPDSTFDWDILQSIGGCAIILIAVRNWRPGTLIAIAVVILLVTPPLRQLVDYDSYWNVTGEFTYRTKLGPVLLGFFLTGYFPLLPWLLYPLIGFALGQLYYRDEKATPLPPLIPALGAVMLVLALLGGLLKPEVPAWIARYYATGWPDGFYPATTVFILASLGGTLIGLWILNRTIDLNESVTGRGPVLTFFRRYSYFALSAYVLHLAIQIWPLRLLALWEGQMRIDYYQGRSLEIPGALVSALLLIVALYLLFIFLDRHKKYSLEYFMRWVSS